MTDFPSIRLSMAALAIAVAASPLAADGGHDGRGCTRIEAHLVEAPSTNCKPGHASCFLGQAKGTHGFRAHTYFKSDTAGQAPPATPWFLPYSGDFEYHTPRGTLVMKETGLTSRSEDLPEQGAVTAFQEVVDATGDLTGSTGYFFVSGFNRDGQVVTRVFGEVCTP